MARRGLASVFILLAGLMPGVAPSASGTAAAADPYAMALRQPVAVWRPERVAALVPNPNGKLRDVSCVSRVECVAVGAYYGHDGVQRAMAERRDARGWHVMRMPDPVKAHRSSTLLHVSCFDTSTCVALGAAGGVLAESWTGGSWRRASITKPGAATVTGMSCGAVRFCLASGFRMVGKTPQAVVWRYDGRSWGLVTAPPRSENLKLADVSCSGARYCTFVANEYSRATGVVVRALAWRRGVWRSDTRVPTPGDVKAELIGISCPQSGRAACVAIGWDQRGAKRVLVARRPVHGGWTSRFWPALPHTTAQLHEISCSSYRACTAVGTGQDYVAGLGRSLIATIGPSSFHLRRMVQFHQLAAVSCPPDAPCIGVGARDQPGGLEVGILAPWEVDPLAMRGYALHFNVEHAPSLPGIHRGSFTAVSCVPSGFCAAGATLHSEVRRDGEWSTPPTNAHGVVTGVSCTSATFCMAVGSYGYNKHGIAERWTGTHWELLPVPQLHGQRLLAVSCTSRTDCIAVGQHGTIDQPSPLIDKWDGANWTQVPARKPASWSNATLNSVSCPSARFCLAAGTGTPAGLNGAPLVESWHGGSWHVTQAPRLARPRHAPAITSVSCTSATFCMAVGGRWYDRGPFSAMWNGRTWTLRSPHVAPTAFGDTLSSVSCRSKTVCVAAGASEVDNGGRALIRRWNGSTWTHIAVKDPDAKPLAGVSCVSDRGCLAVGKVNWIPWQLSSEVSPLALAPSTHR